MGVYEECKNILTSENPDKGIAAANAIGLLFMGTGNMEVMDFIFEYATATQHDKISRSICIAIAIIESL